MAADEPGHPAVSYTHLDVYKRQLVVFRHGGQRQRRQHHAQTQDQRQDFLHVFENLLHFYLYPLCGNSSMGMGQPLSLIHI